MRHLFPALLTLAVLALGACGGGGGESAPSDGEPPISSGELVVRTVRHDSNLAPVSGVSVLLHGPDGRSVERMLTSDADGYARFGDVGRERVTLTTVVGARRITLIDVPEDEYVIRVLPRDNSVSEPFVPCEGLRNISVTSETNDGEYIRLYPRSSVVTTDDESIEFPSQAVCDMHESVDGLVTGAPRHKLLVLLRRGPLIRLAVVVSHHLVGHVFAGLQVVLELKLPFFQHV